MKKMRRKGIILAGGSGTRLYPLTYSVSKQLMPVYDKPMIYYPLSTLMLAGIRDIMIITTPQDQKLFYHLLRDGSQWGISLSYEVQKRPEGLAQAFSIGSDFIGSDPVTLILGDNIFFGEGLSTRLQHISNIEDGAFIFGYYVKGPGRYGVMDFDGDGRVTAIVEKPDDPPSNYAVTGLYFYDNEVVGIARDIRPSARGELEITDVNNVYLKRDKLKVELLNRGTAWLDTGTHESLLDAGIFIKMVEERQGLKIACLEEAAYQMGWITAEQVEKRALLFENNGYGQYLLDLLRREML